MNMLDKKRQSVITKAYKALPLWAKVAVPAAGIFAVIVLLSSLVKIVKIGVGVGLLALIVYAVLRAANSIKE